MQAVSIVTFTNELPGTAYRFHENYDNPYNSLTAFLLRIQQADIMTVYHNFQLLNKFKNRSFTSSLILARAKQVIVLTMPCIILFTSCSKVHELFSKSM